MNNKTKCKYESLQMEIVKFYDMDIITSSGQGIADLETASDMDLWWDKIFNFKQEGSNW